MSIPFRALGRASLHAATAVAAAPAFADMTTPDTIIVTAAIDAAREQVDRTPGGSDVVDAAQFQDRLAVSLRDALAFSPGIYTQPRFGQCHRASASKPTTLPKAMVFCGW